MAQKALTKDHLMPLKAPREGEELQEEVNNRPLHRETDLWVDMTNQLLVFVFQNTRSVEVRKTRRRRKCFI